MIIYNNIEKYLKSSTKKVWIIDKNIFELWNSRIKLFLNSDKYFILESTEFNKNMESYQEITNFLFENNIDRSYTIFGLGGGIIGDITGFVASTYMRGIKLVHIPTTLLSMVDSSIGGKTGFNNVYGKNMIGSIYQANDIVIDIQWLETLPLEHKINGMAEVIKMALIKGGKLFELVNDAVAKSNTINWQYIEEIIKLSANYKLEIIKDDFNDINGDRELLNLGHTWGHAIELSQEMLHGFAVADGIIEEMKYSNYYYNYPSLSTMQTVLSLLKKWKLISETKTLGNNDSLTLLDKTSVFYLSKDKKSDRLVTLKDIGNCVIVKWDIEKWKFITFKYFKLENNLINKKIEQHLKVPPSKSITNRALLAAVIASNNSKNKFMINDILKSEDTELMLSALIQSGIKITEESNNNVNTCVIYPSEFKPTGTYYLGNSGTSVRFLLPILAMLTQEDIIIDGSEEMRKRPIGPLISSLNKFGCNIESLNLQSDENQENYYLPLKIKPTTLKLKLNNLITIDGSLSSQYVTGLILGISFLKSLFPNKNFIIETIGASTSMGFIDMTIKMLNSFGIIIDTLAYSENQVINIIDIKNSITEYNIEGDATTASYLFAWSFINKFKLTLTNLNKESCQPDINILFRMLPFFGKLIDTTDKISFEPFDNIIMKDKIIDLDSSDTFLTWGCLFAMYNKKVEITNIENQNWKECARIDNFIDNIKLLGGDVKKTKTGFKIKNGITNIYKDTIIPTFNDHRMAMSFSLIGMLNHLNANNIIIENPHCVSKTYPKYWEDIKNIGIKVFPINKTKPMSIVLIGMPGNGKTTLAKETGNKLNIEYTDTDENIISNFGLLKELIENKGWDIFRNIETMELFNSIGDSKKLKIISTGGGIIESVKSRAMLENSIVIWIKRNNMDISDVSDRTLQDTYKNLEMKRNNLYESLSDYVYLNDGTPDDFIKWLKLIIIPNPIPSISSFLCKTDTIYEPTISNCIELRGDMIENNGLDLIQKLMITYNRPCIYTLRSATEGGLFKGDNKEYESIIKKAIKNGSKIIDIEVNRTSAKDINILDNRINTIGSIHSNDSVYINDNLNNFNENILKIVTNDQICNNILHMNIPKNRILIDNLSSVFRTKNNYLTPISSSISESTAPNQLNYLQYLEKSCANQQQKFIFLFGNNIGESPSSYIHNHVFQNTRSDNIKYINFESNDINDIIKIINKPYFAGASVTAPYKEDIIKYICNNSTLDAINTVIKRDYLHVENTDTLALKYFKKSLPTFILGTGGAAIGAIKATLNNDVTLVGRNKEKLKLLSKKYNIKMMLIDKFTKIEEEHQIINCMPPQVLLNDFINDNTFLIDMTYGLHNYNKTNTKNINGYDILYVQAAYQYIEWFKDTEYIFDNILAKYKTAMEEFLHIKYY
jgi:pentafunctional AROM polypeptide